MQKKEVYPKEIRNQFKRVCGFLNLDPTTIETQLLRSWVESVQEVVHWQTQLGIQKLKEKGIQSMAKAKIKANKEEEEQTEEAGTGLTGDPLAGVDFGSIANLTLGETSPSVSMDDLNKQSGLLENPPLDGNIKAPAEFNAVIAVLDGLISDVSALQKQAGETHALVESIGKSEQFTTQKLIRETAKKLEDHINTEVAGIRKALQGVIAAVEGVAALPAPATTPKEEPKAQEKEEKKPKTTKVKAKKGTDQPPAVDDNTATKIMQFIKGQAKFEYNKDQTTQFVKQLAGALAGITEEQVYALLNREGRISFEGNLTVGP